MLWRSLYSSEHLSATILIAHVSALHPSFCMYLYLWAWHNYRHTTYIYTYTQIYAPGAPMHPSLYEYSHYILENDVIIANNEPCVSILFCDLAGMAE